MSGPRHERLGRIFYEASGLDPDGRTAFLDEACADDPDLREEVEALLAEDGASPGTLDVDLSAGGAAFLAGALAESGEFPAPTVRHPEHVGKYRILRLIDEGGMGTVYEAEQNDPKRRVALKVVRASMVTRDLLQRFRYEARVLGQLQHPGIAQIYEAGTADTGQGGQPFFAMELVDGEPIDAYADACALDTAARLDLIARLCDVLHYAHQKSVIHRDLKPANILVGGDGQPRVLDFGVARATDADLLTVTHHTTAGQLVGTVPYMSPEQASGDPAAIDIRSDVYAVGVITYELLTGRLPYEVRGKLVHEAVRVIREDEPSSLSATDRTLRGDIETIVAKALEKDKTRRYQSASELAADIRHQLHNEPIEARPASVMYQLRKFARRNKALVGGVIATLIVALAGAGAATRYAIEARSRAKDLEQIVAFQSGLLTGIDVPRMGVRLRESMLAATERAAPWSDGGAAERMARFDEVMRGADFTDIARESLEENIFASAIAGIDTQLAGQPLLQARLHHSLAQTLRQLGILDLALVPLERAIEIRRQILGDEHPDTLSSISEMGNVLERQEKWAKAELFYREVLTRQRRLLDRDDPATIDSVCRLGYVLWRLGETDEANELLREHAEWTRRKYGDDHPSTHQVMAGLMGREGRMEEAEVYSRKCLDAVRRINGPGTPETIGPKWNLACHLNSTGNLDEAAQLFREVLEGWRGVHGHTHPETLKGMRTLGDLLRRQGRLDEAETLLREALATSQDAIGDQSPLTAESRLLLVAVIVEAQRPDEAETLLLEAYAGLEREHPEARDVLALHAERLVQLYEAWDSPGQAAEWRARLEPAPAGTSR